VWELKMKQLKHFIKNLDFKIPVSENTRSEEPIQKRPLTPFMVESPRINSPNFQNHLTTQDCYDNVYITSYVSHVTNSIRHGGRLRGCASFRHPMPFFIFSIEFHMEVCDQA
jgi:hypothetical protein